jgi:hypothetical protein
MFKKMIVGGALAGSLLFAGCGKADEALKELEALKKDACACKDADCANKVQTKFEEWAKKHSDTKGSQSQADKAGKIAEEISECMVKAMTGDAPAEEEK